MKYLFNLLKLFPAFQKLLNEFFEGERAELKAQVSDYQKLTSDWMKEAQTASGKAQESEYQAQKLRQHIGSLENAISIKNAELKELRNATTAKLQAVDSLDSESVFNASLYSPKPGPDLPSDSHAAQRKPVPELRWRRD